MEEQNSKQPSWEILSNARLFTNDWAQKFKISLKKPDREKLLDRLSLDYDQIFKATPRVEGTRKPHYLHKNLLSAALNELITKAEEEDQSLLRQAVKCDSENLEPLRKLLSLSLGKADDFTTYCFAHWLWIVKRKLNNLSFHDVLVPVLYGPQGIGKSLLQNKLSEPFKGYIISGSASMMADEKNRAAVQKNYIWAVDELSGANRADVDELKRLITEEMLSYRPMRTNEVVWVKQNCSFFVTTNKPLNEKVFDTTGMRRWVQFEMQSRADIQGVLSFDVFQVWRGIDENKPEGYLDPVREQLLEHQKEITPEDPFEVFIKESGLVSPNEGAEMIFVPASTIYRSYQVFCEEQGERPMGQTAFSRLLKNRNIKADRQRFKELAGDLRQVRGFLVPASVYLFTSVSGVTV
jgi:hypothetical protein